MRKKFGALASIMLIIVTADVVTKRWAHTALSSGPQEGLFGGLLPFTLAYNRGAAFGIHIGDDPRWFFIPITILALVLLTALLVQAEKGDNLRILALSLVVSGALGNLIDRVRWDRGVVDFLGPVDLGFMDFPIFNVADSAISCGAVLLATSFWLEDRRHRRNESASGETTELAGPPTAPQPGDGREYAG